MAIQFTDSFALELLEGIHDFSTDTFKVALFPTAAALGVSTTVYSASGEVANGSGYTTGGATMSLTATYPSVTSHVAGVRFDTVTWTFTALTTLRYALIYNSSKANRSVMVLDLGSGVEANGLTTITFPLTLDPLITIRNPVPA